MDRPGANRWPLEAWVHELDTGLIVAVAVTLLVWTLVSARLERFDVSAPMAFVAAGLILTNEPVSAINVEVDSGTLRSLAELTLALLLFSDAARVNLPAPRHRRPPRADHRAQRASDATSLVVKEQLGKCVAREVRDQVTAPRPVPVAVRATR